MAGENWIRVAMSDDSLVADALLRLRHSEPQIKSDASPLKLKWSVRQRRSKKGDQTRASPTTPLSWSGATSISGGGGTGGASTVDGLEETSTVVKRSETCRSKICETTATTHFKKSRKKKTLLELKEEEMMLLKERKCLKNELASLHEIVEQERAKNKALKKKKKKKGESSEYGLFCKIGSIFLLPDLNMPLDPESSSEVIC